LWDLVQRPTWLLGFGGMIAAFVLQAVALGLGQLSAVETIITLEVPLTLLIASRVFHAYIGRGEWGGILVMTAGMIALVAALNPRPAMRPMSPTAPTPWPEEPPRRPSPPWCWRAGGFIASGGPHVWEPRPAPPSA
jgi:hypothetical protein